MSRQINTYCIKIPYNAFAIYCEKKNILTVRGSKKKKSIRIKLKIKIDPVKKIINVSPVPSYQISNAEKKKIQILRKTTIAQLKHLFIESSITIFQKLKIVGVGYRANLSDTSNQKLLTLKLGYSHLVYIKAPKNIYLNCLTKTTICIFGNSYLEICEFSARIRSQKIPEPYKGKGVRLSNEKFRLKEGKKI